MAHGNISIRNFIDDIKKGDYVIPHFQRDFDWRPNMVTDLFESILHGYYAGTILKRPKNVGSSVGNRR